MRRALLARGTRGLGRPSFDARSKGQPCHSPKVRWRELEGRRLGKERVLARSGGRARKGARSRDRSVYLVESANENCRGSAQAGFAVGHYEICEFFSWVEIDRQPGQAP